METKILTTKENKLFNRKEITAEISFEKITPKREDILRVIVEKQKESPEHALLKKVKTSFGTRTLKALVYVYANGEVKTKYETKNKKQAKTETKKAE